MKRSNVTTYNFIAILFIGLTIFSFLCTLMMWARVINPPPFLARIAAVTPTIFVAPTDTITPTPSKTHTPTVTPIPPTETPVPPTETPSPTVTPIPPTETPIPPTPIPSDTPVPTATIFLSATPTEPPTKPPTATRRVTATRTPRGFVASKTPTPAPPTKPQATPTLFPTAKPQSNQPFVLDDKTPLAGPNPDFTRGCNYQGVVGLVLDLGKKPLPGTKYKVNIIMPDGKLIQTSYTPQNNTLYANGSFVADLGDKPLKATYSLQVVNNAGKPISDVISLSFEGTCETNVIFVNFNQVKPTDLP